MRTVSLAAVAVTVLLSACTASGSEPPTASAVSADPAVSALPAVRACMQDKSEAAQEIFRRLDAKAVASFGPQYDMSPDMNRTWLRQTLRTTAREAMSENAVTKGAVRPAASAAVSCLRLSPHLKD